MITPNDTTPSPQYTHLLNLIESIRKKTNELETVWEKRRLRVELFVQIKHFEIYSREVSQRKYYMPLIMLNLVRLIRLAQVRTKRYSRIFG
jgi:hypothetical protein